MIRSFLSPSSADRWMHCEGSMLYHDPKNPFDLQPSETYIASEIGTYLHALAASGQGECIIMPNIARHLIDTPKVHKMIKNLDGWHEYVNTLRLKYSHVMIERTLKYYDETLLKGTPDVAAFTIQDGSIHIAILDLKTSSKGVSIDQHYYQLMLYAYLLLVELSQQRNLWFNDDTKRVIISLGVYALSDGVMHSHDVVPDNYAIVTRDQVCFHNNTSLKEVDIQVQRAKIIRDQDLAFNLGDGLRYNTGTHCTYCLGRMTCPVYQESLRRSASNVFDKGVASEHQTKLYETFVRQMYILRQRSRRIDHGDFQFTVKGDRYE